MANEKLNDRPYLLITYIHKPKKGVKTEIKGWKDDENNWETYEYTEFSDSISSKKMAEAAVIIDILGSKVIKNRDGFENVYEHYMTKYKQRIEEACAEFFKKHPDKQEKFFGSINNEKNGIKNESNTENA